MSWLDQFRFLDIGWKDLLQIGIVAYVLYRGLLLIHGTRAVQMLAGLVVLVLVYVVAWLAKLDMILALLTGSFQVAAIAAVIIFQPEIRAALAHLGQSRVTRFFRKLEQGEVVDEIVAAVERLSRSGVGAIIAIEREAGLGDYVTSSGTPMQAKVNAELLATIFTPYSPLHDGAVIIRGDTIIGAGCILPLSQQENLDRSLGTRHRAAIGLTEETDALVIVVSEETATISTAQMGVLTRGLTGPELRDALLRRPTQGVTSRVLAEVRA
jgi:diadenylate cyclase